MKKTLLVAIGLALGLGPAPLAFAQTQAKHSGSLPHFTVVSVKPSPPKEPLNPGLAWRRDGGYWAVQKFTALQIMNHAFLINPQNFVGVPAWARTTRYDIQARMPPGTSDAQFRLMLQSLLAERFQLKAHQEMRPMDVVILTVSPTGAHLHAASRSCVPPPRNIDGFGLVKASPGRQEIAGCGVTMAAVAQYFTAAAIHPVVDETGLKGRYDLDVVIDLPTFSKGEDRNEFFRKSLLATKKAFQQQIGLNLDFTKLVKRPMPVVVIDHLAPATPN